jgi:hypothetical protein
MASSAELAVVVAGAAVAQPIATLADVLNVEALALPEVLAAVVGRLALQSSQYSQWLHAWRPLRRHDWAANLAAAARARALKRGLALGTVVRVL